MEDVKIPASDSYHDYLIESLRKNPELPPAYITATFEEKDPEPELLQAALSNVAEALGNNMSESEAQQHREKLEVLLSSPANLAIYSLADWLNALGLKLTVTVAEKEAPANSVSESEVTV